MKKLLLTLAFVVALPISTSPTFADDVNGKAKRVPMASQKHSLES